MKQPFRWKAPKAEQPVADAEGAAYQATAHEDTIHQGSFHEGVAYVCLNPFCRRRAYQRQEKCPSCSWGRLVSEDELRKRRLAGGMVFAAVGGALVFAVVLIVFALPFFERADAALLAIMFVVSGLGLIFIAGGISQAFYGKDWFIRGLLRALGRRE